MYVRYIKPEDDRMSISEIYERSWKYAYKDILPDSYLNAIPRGHWASVIDSPGWNTLILFEDRDYGIISAGISKNLFMGAGRKQSGKTFL